MSGWGWTVVVLVVIGLLAVVHALRTNWRKLESGDRANLEVNVVLFAFTALSVVIALAAFGDARSSGAEQQKALQASRDELQTMLITLNTQTEILHQAQTTWKAELGVFQRNLDTAKTQLETIKQLQKWASATPKFAIRFEVSSIDGRHFTNKKWPRGSIEEATVPYGSFLFLTLTIRNTGRAPGKDVNLALQALDPKAFNQLGNPVIAPFVLQTDFPGHETQVFRTHYRLVQPNETIQLVIPVQVNQDVHDGGAQFSLWIEGDNLIEHYSQGFVLRKLAKE